MSDPQKPEHFVDRDLSGARFVRCDLSGAVMRGVDLVHADLDSPWLLEPGGTFVVNGVDVVPLIEAELERRFPGRRLRRANDPVGLREAWAAVDQAWGEVLARAAALPEGAVDRTVDDEWSFAQTVRHLVMATDLWIRGAVLGVENPVHPFGMPHAEYELDGYDMSVFAEQPPSYDEVLALRADRVAQVRELVDGLTPEVLDSTRPHPWAPERQIPVRHCLHTILNEEWEHLRYAVRDLDAVTAQEG